MASKSKGNAAKGKKAESGFVRRFFSALGPGIITGAADDDPSGIATYSIAGAQHGLALLWTALITWPLMAFVQMMCARIGMVTGRGLAGGLHKKFPRPVILVAALALFAANSINVGADLSGMADAAEMLTRVNSLVFVILFGVGISLATIFFHYQQIATILKWLALVLFAYVITGFVVHPDWSKVARAAFIPSWPKNHEEWGTLVAILGTTISPYLFFWQASQEVEEEKSKGRRMLARRIGASKGEIITRKIDVDIGTFFSNLVMFFIILTTGLTLHVHGMTNIQTTKDAAQALFPLAGKFAGILFTLGIIGTGLLAIPTLTGSAAYALAETFAWKEGLNKRFRGASHFYLVIVVSTLIGIGMDFLKVNPVRALYWTAVINGLLAPFLLVAILIAATSRSLMKNQPSAISSAIVVSIAALLMFGAAIGMFIF
jgi:NRAMP (natural resistance-associated macrophage protein)-like metal ion transporter